MLTGRSLTIGLVAIIMAMAGLVSIPVQDAHACTCEPPVEPDEEYERVDYVFAREVVAISAADSDGFRDVSFLVTEAWKDVDHQKLTVATPDHSGACGYSFEEGSSYLIYASDNDARYGPEVITGICQRTESLTLAREDLQVLGTGTDAEDLEDGEQNGDGLELWVLVGSIALFLAIVVAIQLLRRWR